MKREMAQPIRVLQMIGSLNIGGSQAMIMNLYRNIDRSKVQFDFIVDKPNEMFFGDEIKKMGGKIYVMPTFKGYNIMKVKRAWKKFFKEHPEYKVIHSHVRSYAAIYLRIAKSYGLQTIIHSHSTSNGTGITSMIKAILQYPLRYIADYFFGCSIESGQWLFGKKIVNGKRYKTIRNAINTEEYIFDRSIRQEYRNKFKIKENDLVVGHVGRFHEAKNYPFLLEMFKDLVENEKKKRYKLMIVGDGEIREQIEKKISDLELQDKVILTGSRDDVSSIMQAMDVFVFPSKWEGLPVTVVEAQASGLPCYISDTITKEVCLCDQVKYLPINKGTECWCKTIDTHANERYNARKKIIRSGFDVKTSARWFEKFYERLFL